MKKLILCIILFTGIFSCTKEDSLVQLMQKGWFQKMMVPCEKNSVCKTSIYKGIYNHETVIYRILSGALCDPVSFVTLYDLNGDMVKVFQNLALLEQEVTNRQRIFRCDE
jgi:hypothetical protein